jgi:hypothetical protein
MVGFKITVNGKTYCESDDISAVTMVASACRFCRREVHEVSKLIQGPSAAICDGCIQRVEILVRKERSPFYCSVAITA